MSRYFGFSFCSQEKIKRNRIKKLLRSKLFCLLRVGIVHS